MKCKITEKQVFIQVKEFDRLNFLANLKDKSDLDYSFKIRCLHGYKD